MSYEKRIEIEAFKNDPETGCLTTEWAAFLVTYDIEGKFRPATRFDPAEAPDVAVEKIVDEATGKEVPFEMVFRENPIKSGMFDKRFPWDHFCDKVLTEYQQETYEDYDDADGDDGDDGY